MSPFVLICGSILRDVTLWWGAALIALLPAFVIAKVAGTRIGIVGSELTLTEFFVRHFRWSLANVALERGAAGDGLVLPGIVVRDRATGEVIRRIVSTSFSSDDVARLVEMGAPSRTKT
jgi:hypothetical protein